VYPILRLNSDDRRASVVEQAKDRHPRRLVLSLGLFRVVELTIRVAIFAVALLDRYGTLVCAAGDSGVFVVTELRAY
jgi:hypothetical protein